MIIGVTPGTCHRVGGWSVVASIVIAYSFMCAAGGAASAEANDAATSRTKALTVRPTGLRTIEIQGRLVPHDRAGRDENFLDRAALPLRVRFKTERAHHRRPRIDDGDGLGDRVARFDIGAGGDPRDMRQ